jgi:hypothetical protein
MVDRTMYLIMMVSYLSPCERIEHNKAAIEAVSPQAIGRNAGRIGAICRDVWSACLSHAPIVRVHQNKYN